MPIQRLIAANRRGVGAKDAGPSETRFVWATARMASRSASAKPPSGPINIRGRVAGSDGQRPPAALHRQNRAVGRRPVAQQGRKTLRLFDDRQGGAFALLGRLYRMGPQSVEIEPIDDGSPGQDRQQSIDSQFTGLFDQPVDPPALDRREQ